MTKSNLKLHSLNVMSVRPCHVVLKLVFFLFPFQLLLTLFVFAERRFNRTATDYLPFKVYLWIVFSIN